MSELGVVEDTLFVPMLGRIYASEYCPQILYDPKALELKKKLPSSLPEQDGQSQYTSIRVCVIQDISFLLVSKSLKNIIV